jgi:uncharacterized glyoxalase superfamily protein PhnB
MGGDAGSTSVRETSAEETRGAARTAAAGDRSTSTAEPHDTDYGSRDFAARDPEGNRWSFGTYRGEPRKG